MTSVEIVVARFQRLPKFLDTSTYPYTIYNTGTTDIPYPNIKINNSPVGGDYYVYWSHIFGRYNSLADITLFLTDDPYDYINIQAINSPNIINLTGFGFIMPRKVPRAEPVRYNIDSCEDGMLPLRDCYRYMFLREPPSDILVMNGSNFYASKDIIRSRPLMFWKRLLDLSNVQISTTNIYRVANCYERLLPNIFNDEIDITKYQTFLSKK